MKRGGRAMGWGGGPEDERSERHSQAAFSCVQCDRMKRVPAALWLRFCRRDADSSSAALELVFKRGGGEGLLTISGAMRSACVCWGAIKFIYAERAKKRSEIVQF